MSGVIIFGSTKTYGHDVGLSCAFRQWRADSHCRFVHGYALAVHLEFVAVHLDDRNWVTDFGGLKDIKAKLVERFDHKVCVADDDPEMAWFVEAERLGLLQLTIVEAVGCEKFAELIAKLVVEWLASTDINARVRLRRVEVREHAGNSAFVELT